MRRSSILGALLFGILSAVVCTAQTSAPQYSLYPLVGIYKLNSNDFVSIAKFDLGDGENRMLSTDFRSRVIRILSPSGESSFAGGSGLLTNPPVEMQIRFVRNKDNEVKGLVWQRDGAARRAADKVNLRREEISFRSGDVTLSGTLISPDAKGLHPVIVFLHGSGGLNRYSFGPFPDYFLSRGYAVLVFDKRGTGSSNGNFETSTFQDLAADGRAAVQFLKGHKGIDARQIDLCGTSQGGFLAALVASGNRDVAFLINLYGMYVPAWQQELYRAEADMREADLSKTEKAGALAFMKLEFDVGRTGQGWDSLATETQQAKDKKWFDIVPKDSTLDELQHDWNTVYSYDPALALVKVSCPVLALFGSLDNSTPVPQTIASMRQALKKARNRSFTYKVFPKGNHGLLESKTGYNSEIPKLKRFVPGLFETMTAWLRERKSARGGAEFKIKNAKSKIGSVGRS